MHEKFANDGFFLARGVYDRSELSVMEAAFDRIVDQLRRGGGEINARWRGETMDKLDEGSSTIIHTHNVHRYSADWLEALRSPRFLAVAQSILGPDIILHHSKLFLKPPQEGSPFPIHQDWWYFPTQKDTMIAAIIFLTDADDASGGLRVYPGSHKLGRLENSSGLEPSESLADYPLESATAISAQPGDVLFFSYFTLHGSTPNRSQSPRKTVLAQLHSGDDFVLPNDEVDHINERLVLSGWNHHMDRDLAQSKR